MVVKRLKLAYDDKAQLVVETDDEETVIEILLPTSSPLAQESGL